jgi:hypothetical protein
VRLAPNDLPYIIPNKSTTTPIEIPRRRRPVVSRNPSSIGRPTSPELIFEMSPEYSEFPSPRRYSLGFSASQEQEEPFMYHFPVLPARLNSDRRTRSNSPSPATSMISSTKHRRSPLCQVNNSDNLTSPNAGPKIMKTKKITGFAPPMQQPLPTQTPYCTVRSVKTMHLSPPPCGSSYSSSPWILPGKSDTLEEESTSLETDPSAFDFERHLMRRIENYNPLRFRTLSLLGSIKG